jgi:LysR family hydrogen peroxide-inducible transcriptional activator
MEIRQLELLRCILEEGSLTAAARRCHLSQPALSQQIQALEADIGEPLLVRKPRGVEATAAGNLLMTHASKILEEAERVRDAFSGRSGLLSGGISFGIIPTLAPYLLPRWIGPFRQRFPTINLSITEARTVDLISHVSSGTIEFAILADVPEMELKRSSLTLKELFREPLLLAAPQDHPLAVRKQPPTPSDLDPAELIHLQGGHCLADRTLRICKIRDPNPGLRCDQVATALAMVAAGLGVSVVPKLATRDVTSSIAFRRFAGEGLHRAISLMRKRSTRNSPAAEELLKSFVSL